jgi:hypothetical protein
MEDINRQIEQLAGATDESAKRVEILCNEARDLKLQRAMVDQALAELATNSPKQPQEIAAELGAKSIEMLEREKAELERQISASEEAQQAIYREEAMQAGDDKIV